jgi:hypothetical protein
MSRIVMILIAAAIVICLAIVSYVLRKPVKARASKVWNTLVRRYRANRYGRAVAKNLRKEACHG